MSTVRALLLGLTTLLTAAACDDESDEELVEETVRRAVEAANQKDAGDVVQDAVSEFKGPKNADLRECRRILTGYFLRRGWLHAFERRLDVTVTGDTAEAQLEVILAHGEPVKKLEDVEKTRASALEFDLKLEKRDGDWKFVAADYRQKPF